MMRGQSSLEAIALFAFATLILTVFMLYFGTQIASQAEEREFESLRDLSGMIRQEILLARQAGPGYERTLTIPRPGSNREVIFTIEYPPGPGSTEMTVRFEPPLNEALEAVEILGEGVYGYFSMGTNTIRTQEGGIIVEPDRDIMDELMTDPDFTPPDAEIAFAHLSGDAVRLIDTIECEYGVSNHWVLSGGGGDVDIAWISRDGADEPCYEEEISYGDRAFLDVYAGLDLSKGRNLSCAARYRHAVHHSGLCDVMVGGADGHGIRVARSSEALIINSPPTITVLSKAAPSGSDEVDTNTTIWANIRVEFEVNDIDQEDTHFNVSLVKDGTNANFIECVMCSWNELPNGESRAALFDLTVPWPVDGECSDINRLSFKLRAIEADSTSELYTLKTVELDNELGC